MADPSGRMRWAAVAAFLLVALHFHFLFVFPSVFDAPAFFGRTWGFDAIRFFSRPWQALFYVAALALCFPSVNKWV